jgi:signal peptidase I
MEPRNMTTKKRMPFLAAFLSLIVSGLGQIYNGQLSKGIILWFISFLVSLSILIKFPRSYQGLMVLLAIKLVVILIIIGDAFWSALRKKEVQLKSYNKWSYYLFIVIFNLVISMGFSQYIETSFPYKFKLIQTLAMEPTILRGERFVIDVSSYNDAKPHRGDIVLLQYPKNSGFPLGQFIGRVIGRPGEKIEGKEGVIYINNKAINEPYVQLKSVDSFEPIILPPNKYFIMGDNRSFSMDSRYRGPVDVKSIYGKYLYKIQFLSP